MEEVWLVILFCCLAQLAPRHTTSDADLGLEERIFTASKVYSLLQLHTFSGRTTSTVDLDDPYRYYLHRIFASGDRHKFDLATIEFVAQLHNSHTFFWDASLDDSNNRPLGFYAMPLDDGKWVVQMSFLENLKPGETISKLDDTPIEEFFLQQQRYIAASSRVAQRRNLFLFPYLFPEQFSLTLEGGRQVSIDRTTLHKPAAQTEGRWVKPSAVAYIRIPAFFDPSLEQKALEYVRQFNRTRVLIVDVRNNAGGIPPQRLIRALMDRPYRGWAESKPLQLAPIHSDQSLGKIETGSGTADARDDTNGLGNLRSNPQLSGASVVKPTVDAFRGRLILLVDGGCISACEDLVEPSKDSGRATLVGETTQGSSGLPFIYDFHNGMSLRIAVKRNYFPDGSEFEGAGIKPDVEVHTTIDDLQNGKDPVLEKALELAMLP